MPLLKPDFDYIRKFAKENAAIVIEPDRAYFVEARIAPVAESQGFRSISDLVQGLRMQRDLSRLHQQVIDALTVNETLFFRDILPFDALRNHVIPDLLARAGARKLRIWSAASSTGQEPYSLAMVLKDMSPAIGPGNVEIHATDLTERVLEHARRGAYTQFEVNRGVPAPLLARYFRQVENHWVVCDEIREMVRFSQLNLADPWPSLPLFDLILLRNVLIYFDVERKTRILEDMTRQLQPSGFLLMGTAESTLGLCSALIPRELGRVTFYQRPE